MNLTETEKAYLAGIFDGEGSVGYYLKGKSGYHTAQVAIYNCDPRVMDWIRDKVKFGSISTNQKTGKYIGWSWICNSNRQVTEFLTTIRPYLIVKSDQVDLLLSLRDAEQEIRSEFRLSPEVLALRERTVEQLKLLKTAHFKSIH